MFRFGICDCLKTKPTACKIPAEWKPICFTYYKEEPLLWDFRVFPRSWHLEIGMRNPNHEKDQLSQENQHKSPCAISNVRNAKRIIQPQKQFVLRKISMTSQSDPYQLIACEQDFSIPFVESLAFNHRSFHFHPNRSPFCPNSQSKGRIRGCSFLAFPSACSIYWRKGSSYIHRMPFLWKIKNKKEKKFPDHPH